MVDFLCLGIHQLKSTECIAAPYHFRAVLSVNMADQVRSIG